MSTVLVCGGRNYNNYKHVSDVLTALLEPRKIKLLIEGGAVGADTQARRWAFIKSIKYHTYKADRERWGSAAVPIRNQQMLDIEEPNFVVAFPGGEGTADMVARARAVGIEVIEVPALAIALEKKAR